jgi:hypothetical protein
MCEIDVLLVYGTKLIDNGHAIRPIAVRHTNWPFAGS